ncbi:MAG TPA: cupin domain-containing protein [Candidatus Hydrogenedentes bacterium]|nr:cupin domain-containing protein [Candidatus Hydrogenedentota bacterium]
MIVKHDSSMEFLPVTMEGAMAVTMKIPIGRDDGSENMIMRLFRIAPGGHTPCHTHDYEHLVRVVSGRGTALDESGAVHELALGQSVFICPNEKHQFANPYDVPFEFTCTILNTDSGPLKR